MALRELNWVAVLTEVKERTVKVSSTSVRQVNTVRARRFHMLLMPRENAAAATLIRPMSAR